MLEAEKYVPTGAPRTSPSEEQINVQMGNSLGQHSFQGLPGLPVPPANLQMNGCNQKEEGEMASTITSSSLGGLTWHDSESGL